ncbi:MAG TPA: malonyl-CoA decarboxylase, partial [Paralcaligenes sp.]
MTDSGTREPESKPAEADRENLPVAANLLARLGRWWERERWPGPAETKTLFSARLTDVAANRLAQTWCERYG